MLSPGSKTILLAIVALTASLLLGESPVTASHLSSASFNRQQGIFDRLEKKMDQKDKAVMEKQALYAQKVQKAQQEAQLIASSVDQSELDDQINADFDKIDRTSINRLAGIKPPKKQKVAIESEVQQQPASLIQKGSKKKLFDDEEEERDDFEGFGSITAMIQNKDKLVEKEVLKQEEIADQQARMKADQAKKQAEMQRKAQQDQNKQNKLQSAKARIQAALDKDASSKKQYHAQPASIFVSSNQPLVASSDSQVSLTSYQKAINSVLEKPTAAIAQDGQVEPEMISSLSNQPTQQSSGDEELGFIGKYSKKISDQEMNAQMMKEQDDQDKLLRRNKNIKLSKSAPKHKGMLARAMEKDMKDQEDQEEKEKNDLMQSALTDPQFQMRLQRLGQPQAPMLVPVDYM